MARILAALVVLGCWLIYEIAGFGMFSLIMKKSDSIATDMWWLLLLSVPLMGLNVLWLASWRFGMLGGLSPWVILTISLAGTVIGSAFSVWLYYRELPNAAAMVGFGLSAIGAMIAACWGE